jgi:hypothetical protein
VGQGDVEMFNCLCQGASEMVPAKAVN